MTLIEDSKTVTAENIDRMVDEGQDITAYIKLDTLQIPNIGKGVGKTHCIIPVQVIKGANYEAWHR